MIGTLRAVIMLLFGFCAGMAQTAEEPLGRLFFTPQQRASLDAGRRVATTKKATGRPAAPRGPKAIELNGIVIRSDGGRTVWINNKSYQDRQPPGMRIEVRDPASAEIQVGRSGPKVDLQVGEAYDRTSRQVSDPLVKPRANQARAKPAHRPGSTP